MDGLDTALYCPNYKTFDGILVDHQKIRQPNRKRGGITNSIHMKNSYKTFAQKFQELNTLQFDKVPTFIEQYTFLFRRSTLQSSGHLGL